MDAEMLRRFQIRHYDAIEPLLRHCHTLRYMALFIVFQLMLRGCRRHMSVIDFISSTCHFAIR